MDIVQDKCPIVRTNVVLSIETIEVTHNGSAGREFIPNGFFSCSHSSICGHVDAKRCPVYRRIANQSEDSD